MIEEKSDNESMESDILKYDYNNTYDTDFQKILNKNDQLIERNKKIEKHMKESYKLYEKKIKDIQSTIEHNAKKLKSIRQQNELLTQEIGDLTKILKLSLEENKLKRELKENESRLFKNNDVSETRNDILQDLNNILGEGSYSNIYQLKNKIETVKEEELHESSDTIFIPLNENNDRLKCIHFINIVPDISNVDYIEDDHVNNRAILIEAIKNKYDPIGKYYLI
jgi:hypothetical protein